MEHRRIELHLKLNITPRIKPFLLSGGELVPALLDESPESADKARRQFLGHKNHIDIGGLSWRDIALWYDPRNAAAEAVFLRKLL